MPLTHASLDRAAFAGKGIRIYRLAQAEGDKKARSGKLPSGTGRQRSGHTTTLSRFAARVMPV
jgi:hypothetical protein